MPQKKIITIFGATGAQGGGLARAILQDKNSEFDSIQENIFIVQTLWDNNTSKKIKNENKADKNINKVVTNIEPWVPIYRPKKPEIKEPINGKNIIDKYIII